MTKVRAKMQVVGGESNPQTNSQTVHLDAVCGKDPFGPGGESEDNTFAKWTPSGKLELTITNPDVFGFFSAGKKYYIDITEAPE